MGLGLGNRRREYSSVHYLAINLQCSADCLMMATIVVVYLLLLFVLVAVQCGR